MRERVLGLEVEYSLFAEGASGHTAAELSGLAVEAARSHFRLPYGSYFWPNGGKLYEDVGHVEWATPECRGPRQALLYDKAGERLLTQATAEIQRRLGSGRVCAAKNNVDGHGNTFGCHENYQVERRSGLFGSEEELWDYLVRKLVPFLVSRQVLCGSGSAKPGRFEISQRAPFISTVVSQQTRHARAIVNSREEPHADPRRFRRLHLILGDANMAEVSTFLKLGTTSLVLEMIEDVFLENGPEPRNPVAALHAISGDPDLQAGVPLHDGRTATALDLQRYYLAAAQAYFDRDVDDETRQVLELWEEALSKLAQAPLLLLGKIDWVTKQAVLTDLARQKKLAWSDPRLRELDQSYHLLWPPDASVFRSLEENGMVETLVAGAEVDQALKQPPPFTRARVRGRAVASGSVPSDWSTVAGCEIQDPLDWCPLRALWTLGLDEPGLVKWLASGLASASRAVRLQAVRGLREIGPPATNQLLDATQDRDPEVRAAAVEALRQPPNRRARSALRRAASDPHFLVRLKAREALAGGS